MSKRRSKGFTLIELIAVLVIMAIIATIVTPLVLNVVRKAKDSANKRSVDAYGKAIDLAVAKYLLDEGVFPTSVDELTIEYSGSEVVCGIKQLNEDSSVYLSECTVGGKEVKDSSTDDGWYHYGKSSAVVYQSYNIGDIITYNGMNFYVIENSDENSGSVTMLKAEPIKTSEVDLSGTEIATKVTESTNNFNDGYIHSDYLYSDTCTSVSVSDGIATGCTTDYKLSSIKQVVDAWVADKFQASDLKEDETGYSTRLITYDEYVNLCEIEEHQTISGDTYKILNPIFDWMYNANYYYWTMSQYGDSSLDLWNVYSDGNLYHGSYVSSYTGGVVRPVVTLLKSAL